MQIQVNTDNNIDGNADLIQEAEEILGRVLARFADKLTRLEVHLSDEDGTSKSVGADKKCVLEARIEGRPPTSASDMAPTTGQAVNGAARKMVRVLESELGKLGNR